MGSGAQSLRFRSLGVLETRPDLTVDLADYQAFHLPPSARLLTAQPGDLL